MNQPAAGLPKGFEDLAPFVGEWGDLQSQEERYLRRQQLPMDRLVAFYEAITPRLAAIFEHLDSFPFGEPLPASEGLLFRVVMGLSEVAQAIEVFGEPTVKHAPVDHRVRIETVSPA